MAHTYKLEHFTKGTGANIVADDRASEAAEERPKLNTVRLEPERRKARTPGPKVSTALPPGHVRKKATGELGKVRAVDPKAGTATVLWLRSGAVSTVPLTAISRR